MSSTILFGKNANSLVALSVNSDGLIQTTSQEMDGLEGLIGTSNTSLGSVDTKLSSVATHALQTAANSLLGTIDGDTGNIKTATEVLSASDGAKATHALQSAGNTLLGNIDSDTNDIKGSVASIALNTAVVARTSATLYNGVNKSAGDYSVTIDLEIGEQRKSKIMLVGKMTSADGRVSVVFGNNASTPVFFCDGTYANLYGNGTDYEYCLERTDISCRYVRVLFQNACNGVVMDYFLT